MEHISTLVKISKSAFESDIEVKGRVYIIDDRDRVTMLWANEY